jgi:hypothetical protein
MRTGSSQRENSRRVPGLLGCILLPSCALTSTLRLREGAELVRKEMMRSRRGLPVGRRRRTAGLIEDADGVHGFDASG